MRRTPKRTRVTPVMMDQSPVSSLQSPVARVTMGLMDVEALIAPRVRDMQPYAPIVPFEVLSKRLGRRPHEIVKLDANENPYGSSPKALDAVARSRELHIYPDPDQTGLRQAVAEVVGVPMQSVLCGDRGGEVIDLVARAFVEPGDTIVDLPPTFGMYKWEADMTAARYLKVARRADFSIDVDATVGAVEAAAA